MRILLSAPIFLVQHIMVTPLLVFRRLRAGRGLTGARSGRWLSLQTPTTAAIPRSGGAPIRGWPCMMSPPTAVRWLISVIACIVRVPSSAVPGMTALPYSADPFLRAPHILGLAGTLIRFVTMGAPTRLQPISAILSAGLMRIFQTPLLLREPVLPGVNITVPLIFRAVLLLAVRSIILAPYMRQRCLLVTQRVARAPAPLFLMPRVSSTVCSSPMLAGGMLLSLLRAASLTRRPGMFLLTGVPPGGV